MCRLPSKRRSLKFLAPLRCMPAFTSPDECSGDDTCRIGWRRGQASVVPPERNASMRCAWYRILCTLQSKTADRAVATWSRGVSNYAKGARDQQRVYAFAATGELRRRVIED